MKRLPANWHIYQNRNWPSASQRRSRRERKHYAVGATTGTVIGVMGLAAGLLATSPFSPFDTLRHFASFPNCDAARAVGLAPAMKGQPGYWSSHDRDRDGTACEPWPRYR